jgi:hypothetical protein
MHLSRPLATPLWRLLGSRHLARFIRARERSVVVYPNIGRVDARPSDVTRASHPTSAPVETRPATRRLATIGCVGSLLTPATATAGAMDAIGAGYEYVLLGTLVFALAPILAVYLPYAWVALKVRRDPTLLRSTSPRWRVAAGVSWLVNTAVFVTLGSFAGMFAAALVWDGFTATASGEATSANIAIAAFSVAVFLVGTTLYAVPAVALFRAWRGDPKA